MWLKDGGSFALETADIWSATAQLSGLLSQTHDSLLDDTLLLLRHSAADIILDFIQPVENRL